MICISPVPYLFFFPFFFLIAETVVTLQVSSGAADFNQRLNILIAVKSFLSSASAELWRGTS